MTDYKEIINQAYHAFNNRNISAVLAFMDKDVHWPNGWEGGYVEGQNAVRDYWTRQWKELNPFVQPVSFKSIDDDKLAVTVHQLVKDMKDTILFDGNILHIYTFKNGLIKSMEIKQ